LFPDIAFPEATPLVMKMERTFWEKLTAAHVFCLQSRLRGERFSRHWHDIAKMAQSSILKATFPARQYGELVVAHKSVFFAEKDQSGSSIDYSECLRGGLRLVPTRTAYEVLAEDYAKMAEDGILLHNPPKFHDLMDECAEIEQRLNQALAQSQLERLKDQPYDGGIF